MKIRGLRIELGEIENAIINYKGIRQSAVVDKKDSNGRQYICAYYIGDDVDITALKKEMSQKLPKFMIPHFFIKMEQFPTTPSGKTDRKSFPLPDFSGIQSDELYVAPKNELEKALCEIAQRVLGADKIGTADDFFDIGGDSLKAD